MARHIDQYSMNFNESVELHDFRESKSINFSDQEKRLKSLEIKMDFIYKRLSIELPPSLNFEYSNWKEFLTNLDIQCNEDVLFLLEQNFNLPTTKKNENKNAQYLLNKYGYDSAWIDPNISE